MNASFKLILVASLAAFSARNTAHGFQSRSPHIPTQNRSHGHQARARTGTGKTCLHVVRRPLRPASTEKKRAERKAIIQSRQHEALQDPSLLTDLSFSACHVHPSSQRALVEDMGLRTMTEVQAKTFAGAAAGQDVLARARTGTGKTLAFLVPTVERIIADPERVPGKTVSCLIVSPTRELAIQIGAEAEKLLLHHSDLSVQVMFGGTKMARDMNALNERLPSILVATPGRLLDHLKETRLRGRKFSHDIMAHTNIVVLDETDRLLGMGFQRDILNILSYLPRKEKRQTMLFSATIPKGMTGIAEACLREDYLKVDCVRDGVERTPTNLRVTQSRVILPNVESILSSVYSILKQSTMEKPSKVVVFFPTARMVSFFAEFFQDGFEHSIIELHSKKSQSARNTASDNFRRAKNAILFTSDLSARGIDWPDCTTVIQVGSPESRDQYIHRLGRTARAGKDGAGLLVLLPFEAHFLSELRGLQVIPNQELAQLLLQPFEHSEPAWVAQRLSRIQSGGNKLAASAQLAYLSFLGYYLGQAHRMRCDKAEIVQMSNAFSTAIGLAHVPRIPQKLISKMELGGIPGVFVEEEET